MNVTRVDRVFQLSQELEQELPVEYLVKFLEFRDLVFDLKWVKKETPLQSIPNFEPSIETN